MNKIDTIATFLRSYDSNRLIQLHNAMCHRNHYDESIIYSMDSETLNIMFNTPAELMEAIRRSKDFHADSKYFRMYNQQIRTDIMISTEDLAEYLVNWGDGEVKLTGLDDYLLNELTEYISQIVDNKYSKDQVRDILSECNMDFLMDDWDDILHDEFDFYDLCNNCGEAIYNTDKREYIYESGRCRYTCPACGGEVLD